MNEKRDCKIVQDLLPNYIEDLTNEETNLFIEEHLKECSKCKQIFENMKQDLTIDKPVRDSRRVKYIKKYNKKLKFMEILVVLSLIIALGVMTNHYLTMKNAFSRASNIVVDMAKEGRYPNTFYAIIENISNVEDIKDVKLLKVKGLDINEKAYKSQYEIEIPLLNVGNNIKIQHNGEDIPFEKLKIGQKIAVYDYSTTKKQIKSNTLISVYKIVILNEEL